MAHPGPFRRMGGLDPGETGGDEALSALALLWVGGMDDQLRDPVLLEGEVRSPSRTGIADDTVQFVRLVIGAGHLLALDVEVTQFEMRSPPDQVVQDSPHARIPNAFLFDQGRLQEQGRCRASIGAIDGILIGVQMGNKSLGICLHRLTSYSSTWSTFKHLFSYYTLPEYQLQLFAFIQYNEDAVYRNAPLSLVL